MVTIAEMAKRWKAVNLIEIATDAMEENNWDIVDLNRAQMDEGINALGQQIKPQYTKLTKFLKQQKGQRWDVVTLHDTGEFQSKMFLKLSGNKFSIDSSDSKTADLEKKYGNGVFGLGKDSKQVAWHSILHSPIVRRISDLTGCRIA